MYHVEDRQRPNTVITFPFILSPIYTSSTSLFMLIVVNILVLCRDHGSEIRAKTFRMRLVEYGGGHLVVTGTDIWFE